jgi:hypothetical protein
VNDRSTEVSEPHVEKRVRDDTKGTKVVPDRLEPRAAPDRVARRTAGRRRRPVAMSCSVAPDEIEETGRHVSSELLLHGEIGLQSLLGPAPGSNWTYGTNTDRHSGVGACALPD